MNWENVKPVHKDQETEKWFMIISPYFTYALIEVNIE